MSISSRLCDVYHLLEIMWRKKNFASKIYNLLLQLCKPNSF